jgi:hypothetical protein
MPEDRGERPQRVHAVDFRQRPHGPDDRFGQHARGGELRLQIAELRSTGQPSVPQQETDLFERRAAFRVREIVNVVSVIREHAARAVEVADCGFAGDDVFQTAFGLASTAMRGTGVDCGKLQL